LENPESVAARAIHRVEELRRHNSIPLPRLVTSTLHNQPLYGYRDLVRY
jgi:hypothetical protein